MPPSASTHTVFSDSTFDDFVALYQMPPPGPEYFRVRRTLWLTPRSHAIRKTLRSDSSSAHDKLVEILQAPEAVYSDSCWKNGIEMAWKGLSKGARLKHGLPLNLAIKIVQASWVRDDTWPAGVRAPESDDEISEELLPEPMVLEHVAVKKSPLVPSAESQHPTEPNQCSNHTALRLTTGSNV